MIYIAIFCVIFTKLDRRTAKVMCAVMLCTQIIDISEALSNLRERFTGHPAWSSPMTSPLWNTIAKKYKRILFVLPRNEPEGWVPLVDFAANNGMAINTGYLARVSKARVDKARQELSSAILANELSSDSLYVFDDDALWSIAATQVAASDFAEEVDGFRIIAPRMRALSNLEQR
ncbi:MAG: hypothetical protein ACRESZ_03400 [Methylococcales bacterium]